MKLSILTAAITCLISLQTAIAGADVLPPHYEMGDSQGEATVRFERVTRKVPGEWLRVQFQHPSVVDYIYLKPNIAGMRIYRAYVITSSGQSIPVTRFTFTGTFYSGLMSEGLGRLGNIVAIDICAESMGGDSDLDVRVVGRYGAPSIYPVRL